MQKSHNDKVVFRVNIPIEHHVNIHIETNRGQSHCRTM